MDRLLGGPERLTRTLNALFGHPCISIHHDHSKSKIDETSLRAENIEFVIDYSRTGWGEFGVISGAIKAFQLMKARWGLPEWIFLISESCYPIKPASAFYAQIRRTRFDVHLHHELIDKNNIRREWTNLCYKRYCMHPSNPFCTHFPCFAGEFWFHANSRAINALLNFHERNPLLAQYYSSLEDFHIQRKILPTYSKAGGKSVPNPEESYFHTILCNNYELSISPNHYRFIDWDRDGDVPATLATKDFMALMESNALIARKFNEDHDSRILDQIDKVIGIS